MKWSVGLVLVGMIAVACGRTSKTEPDGATGGTGPDSVAGAAGTLSATSGAGNGTGGTMEPIEPCKASAVLAPAGLRPLGQAELRNELAIFGEPLTEMELPTRFSRIYEAYDGGPDTEPRQLDSVFLQRHAKFVAALTERVTADADRVGALLGCDVARDAALCQAHLLDFVMERLFRGLASDARRAELEAIFVEAEVAAGDFQAGAKAVLDAALQDQDFLYHVERGRAVSEEGLERMQLTGLELASQLSFLWWGSGPDAELLKLARAGGLSQPSDIAATARRLLDDPRAELGIARFYRELLGIDEGRRFDADPEIAAEVLALMDRELSSFVWHATMDPGKGDVASLLEPMTWANGALADYYGWPGAAGDDFQTVALEPTRYAGLLTLPAWLTRASGPATTHPSVRGWWVARGLLCDSLPAEPEGVAQPPGPPNLTERQRLAAHSSNPTCAGCHQHFDPPGLALEHFDGVGRYRENDDGLHIDTSDLPTPDGSRSFDGVRGLAGQIVAADAERNCLTQQWTRFALGAAAIDAATTPCATEVQQLTSRVKSVPELLVALTQTEAFRYRAPAR